MMTRNFRLFFTAMIFTVLVVSSSTTSVTQAEAPLDFTRDIRPILSNKCFHCHGPDQEKREGGLRLDTKKGAFAETDSSLPAIVPNKPEESELFRRITTHDDSEQMPPAETGSKLTAVEIEKVKKWIQQGGEFAGHWAYEKIVRHPAPKVKNKKWIRNEIDAFILSKLEQEKLAPQRQASREVLIRRLSLSLTGLPPTPEEVDAFLNDQSKNAYEKVVDRLLASNAYGEHWARSWLDLARYADSAGYADDPPRTIWAYRDYVIKSLNENKRFDQFTIEQIAGDLLPSPTEEQLIATAFHRNTLTNSEGGTIDEEFRNAAIIDRVNTTFAVWMGTTITCANCHTHKFDPISQKEYFQIFSIFNSTEDADIKDERPLLQYFTAEQKQQKKEWQQQLATLKKRLETSTPSLLASQKKWEAQIKTPLKWSHTIPQKATSAEKVEIKIRDEKTVFVANSKPNDTYKVHLAAPVKKDAADQNTKTNWQAIRFETLPDNSLPAKGAGNSGGGNFVITKISAAIEPTKNRSPKIRYVRIELPGKNKFLSLAEVQVFSANKNVALQGTATQSSVYGNAIARRAIDNNTEGNYRKNSTTHTEKSTNPWWEVDLKSTHPVNQIVLWNRTDGNTQSRLNNALIIAMDEEKKVIWKQAMKTAPPLKKEFPLHISTPVEFVNANADFSQHEFDAAFVLDKKTPNKRGWAVAGKINKPHFLTLIPKSPFQLQADEELIVTIEQQSAHKNHTLGHFRISLTDSETVAETTRVKTEMLDIARLPVEKRDAEQKQKLRRYYSSKIAPELKSPRQQAATIEKSLANRKPYTTVPIMKQLPKEKHRKTFVQIRGNYLSPGEEVQPGLLSAFHSSPKKEEGLGRLDLAHWLIDKKNPLTPRVVANRYWEKLFGVGLVSTSEEFGSQGELPSHPKLTDWLATELLRLNWDTKAFIKTIVMSSTYRQSAVVTEEKLERDPKNRFLTRGPRFRLTAEMVRDQALLASGLLSRKMYGPPVKPPQPDFGLNAAFGGAIDWKTSTGEDKHRRGLYTNWRRSNPYPSMVAFDAPNRETCTLNRERTNTPLQAFVTLNDPVYIETAQAIGRRMAKYEGTLEEKMTFGFCLCTARKPEEKERQRLIQLYESARKQYQQDKKAAKELATDPIGPLPKEAIAADFAAWTLVGNVLLNLDEILMIP